MIKYALIENEELGTVQVGIGDNAEYYKTLGMEPMDVEQAWNGNWYLKDRIPEKPQDLINRERISELKQRLVETDYVAMKLSEVEGEERAELLNTYADVLAERKAAREEINRLEEELNA